MLVDLLVGVPFYTESVCRWKSLVSIHRPIGFCAVTVRTCDRKSYLIFCVYTPCDCHPSSFTDYLNTLSEVHGLIDANPNSGVFLMGYFNVDFDCSGPFFNLFSVFVTNGYVI